MIQVTVVGHVFHLWGEPDFTEGCRARLVAGAILLFYYRRTEEVAHTHVLQGEQAQTVMKGNKVVKLPTLSELLEPSSDLKVNFTAF